MFLYYYPEKVWQHNIILSCVHFIAMRLSVSGLTGLYEWARSMVRPSQTMHHCCRVRRGCMGLFVGEQATVWIQVNQRVSISVRYWWFTVHARLHRNLQKTPNPGHDLFLPNEAFTTNIIWCSSKCSTLFRNARNQMHRQSNSWRISFPDYNKVTSFAEERIRRSARPYRETIQDKQDKEEEDEEEERWRTVHRQIQSEPVKSFASLSCIVFSLAPLLVWGKSLTVILCELSKKSSSNQHQDFSKRVGKSFVFASMLMWLRSKTPMSSLVYGTVWLCVYVHDCHPKTKDLIFQLEIFMDVVVTFRLRYRFNRQTRPGGKYFLQVNEFSQKTIANDRPLCKQLLAVKRLPLPLAWIHFIFLGASKQKKHWNKLKSTRIKLNQVEIELNWVESVS